MIKLLVDDVSRSKDGAKHGLEYITPTVIVHYSECFGFYMYACICIHMYIVLLLISTTSEPVSLSPLLFR